MQVPNHLQVQTCNILSQVHVNVHIHTYIYTLKKRKKREKRKKRSLILTLAFLQSVLPFPFYLLPFL